MEEGVTILEAIKREFDCREIDIRTYSPLTLAYIGDAIYELVVRTIVVERSNTSANNLHKKAICYVNATAQARMIEALQADLSEEERTIYKRGRNAKSYTTAKNASVIDYRKATGFEALCGYLYLTGKQERMLSLIKKAVEATEVNI